MPRFKSKPRTITAERFHKDKAHDPKGVCRGGMGCEEPALPYNNYPHVHTMHSGQSVQLADGDWIVAEPDGIHYYPIKDEVMKANWERVEGEPRCQICGGADFSVCPNCIGRFCKTCQCFEDHIAYCEESKNHECDGTNCPPRAHDHKVTV